ncbi:MAG: hypothetical protein ACRC1H_18870, partial [Caldilineaceae bacterium]
MKTYTYGVVVLFCMLALLSASCTDSLKQHQPGSVSRAVVAFDTAPGWQAYRQGERLAAGARTLEAASRAQFEASWAAYRAGEWMAPETVSSAWAWSEYRAGERLVGAQP